MNFSPDVMFDYNLKEKRKFAHTTFAILGLIIVIAILYILLFQNTTNFFIVAIKNAIIHVVDSIKNKTLLGVFYASSIGGLFFVTISLEAVFFTFLKSGYSPILLVGIYIFGLLLSYTINYFLGMRLAKLTQKAVTPQKFYKIKGILNKYGVLAIFFFNVLPLPSQPLSAILGVFKYNKAKFYTFFLLGQIIKYAIIILAVFFLGI